MPRARAAAARLPLARRTALQQPVFQGVQRNSLVLHAVVHPAVCRSPSAPAGLGQMALVVYGAGPLSLHWGNGQITSMGSARREMRRVPPGSQLAHCRGQLAAAQHASAPGR